MAEGDKIRKLNNDEAAISDDSDVDEPVRLDLINLNLDKHEHPPVPTASTHNESIATNTRRDENPFSFKHFLQTDKSNYQNQGARPKVYCEGRPITSASDLDLHSTSESKPTRVVPEYSSALPDFVQDHLVIEQCYLGNLSQNKYNIDVNNLPDFAPSRNSNLNSRDGLRNLETRHDNSTNSIPFDLPVRPQAEFPLDLPISEGQPGSRNCPLTSEVGNSKSLPDFLADGAVRTQNNDNLITSQSPERDSDRLRQELDLIRRQLSEQIRRADYLSRELDIARNKEHEYTQNLAKALEQVEENLKRSNIRAATSEKTIIKLKQEVKSLNNEVNFLRRENRNLQSSEGAMGGPNIRTSDAHMQHLAHELRAAANTAEHSLRQLLTGVDNLRMLASSVESSSRFQEDYQSDEDEPGPNL